MFTRQSTEAFGRISKLFLCEVDTDTVFGQGWRARRDATTGVLVLTVQKIVELLQSQFLDKGVDVPVVARLVIVVPKTVEVLQFVVDVGLSSSWTRLSTCLLLCTSWFVA